MKTNLEKGITVISLVITIVLMLILGSVIVTGAINGNLFKKAGETNLREEIATIKIALDKKLMLNNGKVPDGKVNEILGIDSKYNEGLSIEGNELIYISSKWPEEDLKILEDMGIFGGIFDKYNSNKDTIYYIANEETVNSDLFKPLTNMGTLEDFRDLVNAGTFSYEEARLIEDIKLNEGKYEVTDEGITFAADAEQWTPIGTFNKMLDGKGYEITGIYIDNTNSTTGKNLGLFSETGSSATIQNLGIKESSIKGYSYIGTFTGTNAGNIKNCYSLATLESTYAYIGGISGKNSKTGTIDDCYYEGYAFMKTGTTYVYLGGITGENLGNVISSVNKGTLDIAGLFIEGGICGSNNGIINTCYNEGEIVGTKNILGGISGQNGGTIKNSYNMGNVGTGYKSIGGISGDTLSTSIIINCYNTGEIGKGSDSVGGITGGNNGLIENCYNVGNASAFGNVGGITGTNSGTVKSCYNKGTATGSITPVGGIVGNNDSSTKTPTIANCYNVGKVIKSATSYVGAGEIAGKNGTTGIINNCYFLNLSGYGIAETNNGTTTNTLAKTEAQMKAQDGSFIELLNYGLSVNVFIEKQGDFPILSWQAK